PTHTTPSNPNPSLSLPSDLSLPPFTHTLSTSLRLVRPATAVFGGGGAVFLAPYRDALYNEEMQLLKTLQHMSSVVPDGDGFTAYANVTSCSEVPSKKKGLVKKYRIRLRGIDATESDQDYDEEVTDELKNIIATKSIAIQVYYIDPYGRCVSDVYCEGKLVHVIPSVMVICV
ncbi:hypothetical protein M8C21_004783, partial [Ambrosia artemisiifolia]